MDKKVIEVRVADEPIGLIGMFIDSVKWIADPLTDGVQSIVDSLSDSTFEDLADGKSSVTEQGVTLEVIA